MKSKLFTAIAAVILVFAFEALAHADGFRCEGQGYHVKAYHRVDRPSQPFVLVVSQGGLGTTAVVKTPSLTRTEDKKTVTYTGQTHATKDGRFMRVTLAVDKDPRTGGAEAGTYPATLTTAADGELIELPVDCLKYETIR